MPRNFHNPAASGELHGLVEHLESLFKPPLALQRGAEARKVLWFGILADGSGEPLHGEIVLRGVKRQQAHQMKGVRVVGVRFKRLLATKLSVEILLGSQMAEAGLTECRGCAGVGAV